MTEQEQEEYRILGVRITIIIIIIRMAIIITQYLKRRGLPQPESNALNAMPENNLRRCFSWNATMSDKQFFSFDVIAFFVDICIVYPEANKENKDKVDDDDDIIPNLTLLTGLRMRMPSREKP